MTNFKVGQKVVYVGTDPDYPKREWHVIKTIRKAPCGCNLFEIDCGYANDSLMRCPDCGDESYEGIYWKRSRVFRPLSYSSNVNMEVISLFQPTEERQDIQTKPKEVEV